MVQIGLDLFLGYLFVKCKAYPQDVHGSLGKVVVTFN
jgi:hypothetical protein